MPPTSIGGLIRLCNLLVEGIFWMPKHFSESEAEEPR
jgi:hypothetical protein